MKSDSCDLYYEVAGEGVPILLIHPSGSTASTWGSVADDLARLGQVIVYDRRGYARSGGRPPHSMAVHTRDAAAILEALCSTPAVVVGTSAGAGIALDLAVRRPDLVHEVVAHEFPWRFAFHLPARQQLAALANIGSLVARGRDADAAEVLLRLAYTDRNGRTTWDAFPEEWRQVARANAAATLIDFVNSITNYPTARDFASVEVPVVCSYGALSSGNMVRLVRALAYAIPGARLHEIDRAAHAATFDAEPDFVRLVASATLNYAEEKIA